MGKYADLMIETFNTKIENGATTDGPIRFTSRDLRTAVSNMDVDSVRQGDAIYYYNFRHTLPDELQEYGYKHVVSVGGDGQDGVYVFTKIPQQVNNTGDYDESILIEEDSLPDALEQYVSGDEQGSLTQVRQLNLMDDILDMKCYHLQSHLRTEIENQKMEVDEVYIGVDSDEHHAIIVEAKGEGEELNRSQLIRNTIGLRKSPDYPDSVITTGLKVDEEGIFYISTFNVGELSGDLTDLESEIEVLNVDLDIEKTWRFIFGASVDEEEMKKQATIDEVVE